LAELAARAMIEADGWDVLGREESRSVEREEYLRTNSLEYFDQAIADGVVLVIHTWPIGGDQA